MLRRMKRMRRSQKRIMHFTVQRKKMVKIIMKIIIVM